MAAGADGPPAITPADVAAVLGGAATIGTAVTAQADLERAVRAGLPLACVDAAVAADILREGERFVVLSRLRRWVLPNRRLSVREGMRLVRVARITLHARALLPVPEQAAAWMRENLFDGRPALRFARSARGAGLVEDYLWRQFFGIYS